MNVLYLFFNAYYIYGRRRSNSSIAIIAIIAIVVKTITASSVSRRPCCRAAFENFNSEIIKFIISNVCLVVSELH